VSATLVRNESAGEFFRELVESAMAHQHLSAREMTSFYIVNLLSGFIRMHGPDDDADQPLAIRLAQALQADRIRQRDGLRRVGDQSLFISGFFADSLHRSLVDVDYYISLGEYAYGSLARSGDDALQEVFDELADKFGAFVDVLAEVSERSALTSNADVLRLYEKWLRTGSRRSGDLLAARGILPNASLKNTRTVQ
jgi:hypothetical protein